MDINPDLTHSHSHGEHVKHHSHHPSQPTPDEHGPETPSTHSCMRWPSAQNTFIIALVLNVMLVGAQFFYGLVSHSTALVADAGHNLSDALGLGLALAAALVTTRIPRAPYTYGMHGASSLAALANGILLLLASGAIAFEAVHSLLHPVLVESHIVMILAAAGVIINGACAVLLSRLDSSDVNARAAFLHMAADAGISASVAVSALIGSYTGWTWVDPVLSLFIVAWIASSSWRLTLQALRLSLLAAPDSIKLHDVQAHLSTLPGVLNVHDLHVWAIGSTQIALTVHLVTLEGRVEDNFLSRAQFSLTQKFGIGHSTIQIESESSLCTCPLMKSFPVADSLAHHSHSHSHGHTHGHGH